mgnify:CR=1 FL=1
MTDWTSEFNALSDAELDKLAVLRVMECANGVIQYKYRDKEADALSAEDTRRAMGFSMSSIKRMQIVLESETIDFDDHTKKLMGEVRDLYIKGMKRNDDESYAKFLVASLACLKACGIDRLEAARDKLFDDCYHFPAYTWQWGIDYIRGFIANEQLLE